MELLMNDFLLYEVETRFAFNSQEEAVIALPFLIYSLKDEVIWETRIYGIDLFKTDKLLRTSDVQCNNKVKHFLSFKEPDVGRFCNIRLEIDEEITSGLEDIFLCLYSQYKL
jgi:adenylate cyclase class IV